MSADVNTPRITCSCPVCGAMTLPVTSFSLVVCASRPERSFYQFTCATCHGLVSKHASERVVAGLSERGVTVTGFPLEALEEPVGPALTADDLLDFQLALADPAVTARALEALSLGPSAATGTAADA